MNSKPPAIDALTSLRFFAAAGVLVFHLYRPFFGPGPFPDTFSLLPLGVSFFFVLSGFVLTYVYQGGFSAGPFYLARFARLWPVHIVTLALVLATLVPHVLKKPEWTLPLIANATMLHAWTATNGYVFSFNSPSWSISAEVFFYLLFPLFKGRWFWRLYIATLALTAGLLALVDYVDPAVRGQVWQFSGQHFVMQHPIMRLAEFATGVGAAKLFLSRPLAPTRGTVLEVGALGVVALYMASVFFVPTMLKDIGGVFAAKWYSQAGGFFAFAAFVYVFAHQQGAISRALQWRPLVFLGEISFSTYMLHQIVIRWADKEGYAAEWGTWAAILWVLAVTYVGSASLYFLVERPGRVGIMALSRLSRGRARERVAV